MAHHGFKRGKNLAETHGWLEVAASSVLLISSQQLNGRP
jgi:hypothetical protein